MQKFSYVHCDKLRQKINKFDDLLLQSSSNKPQHQEIIRDKYKSIHNRNSDLSYKYLSRGNTYKRNYNDENLQEGGKQNNFDLHQTTKKNYDSNSMFNDKKGESSASKNNQQKKQRELQNITELVYEDLNRRRKEKLQQKNKIYHKNVSTLQNKQNLQSDLLQPKRQKALHNIKQKPLRGKYNYLDNRQQYYHKNYQNSNFSEDNLKQSPNFIPNHDTRKQLQKEKVQTHKSQKYQTLQPQQVKVNKLISEKDKLEIIKQRIEWQHRLQLKKNQFQKHQQKFQSINQLNDQIKSILQKHNYDFTCQQTQNLVGQKRITLPSCRKKDIEVNRFQKNKLRVKEYNYESNFQQVKNMNNKLQISQQQNQNNFSPYQQDQQYGKLVNLSGIQVNNRLGKAKNQYHNSNSLNKLNKIKNRSFEKQSSYNYDISQRQSIVQQIIKIQKKNQQSNIFDNIVIPSKLKPNSNLNSQLIQVQIKKHPKIQRTKSCLQKINNQANIRDFYHSNNPKYSALHQINQNKQKIQKDIDQGIDKEIEDLNKKIKKVQEEKKKLHIQFQPFNLQKFKKTIKNKQKYVEKQNQESNSYRIVLHKPEQKKTHQQAQFLGSKSQVYIKESYNSQSFIDKPQAYSSITDKNNETSTFNSQENVLIKKMQKIIKKQNLKGYQNRLKDNQRQNCDKNQNKEKNQRIQKGGNCQSTLNLSSCKSKDNIFCDQQSYKYATNEYKQNKHSKSNQKKFNKSVIVHKKPQKTKNELQKFVIQLIKQKQLDQQFRNAKIWFQFYYPFQNKWEQLMKTFNLHIPNRNLSKCNSNQFENSKKQQISYKNSNNQANHQINTNFKKFNLQQIKSIFSINLNQHDPFYPLSNNLSQNFNQTHNCIIKLIDSYLKAQKFWQQNIKNKFNAKELIKNGFSNQNIDLESKGHILLEDIVRFINLNINSMYRNRDLVLIYQRIKSGTNSQLNEKINRDKKQNSKADKKTLPFQTLINLLAKKSNQ